MAYTTIDKPTDYFNTKLYTGTGSTNAITGVGFQPDLTWVKSRSVTSTHKWMDVVRGNGNTLASNNTNAEASDSSIFPSLDSDGFTVAGNTNSTNASGQTYASWSWLAGGTASSNTDGSITSSVSANTTAGFSIVSYTGTGANATVGHGLGSDCKLMIIKNRTDASNWIMYHQVTAENRYMELNTTNAEAINFDYWQSTKPTSSVFTIGTANTVNGSSDNMIAYCFAEKKGFSKMGSYVGNGSTDGSFVYLGFKPAWVMIKRTDSVDNWVINDNKRLGYNVDNNELFANLSNTEDTNDVIDLLSNGWKLRHSAGRHNNSGGSYIYMAFAESPFVTSTGIPTVAR